MRSNFTIVWGQVNSTWQDTIEVAFVAASCLVLLVTLQVGFLANLFVAWAVHHQKSLQTSNNALLVNLAVIDILRCAIDCPLLLSVVLSARDLGVLFCSAQIASFSLVCCVQLLTLACISAERYQAIAHPFKNAERRKRITVWIALTWLLPISISVICVIFAKDSPVYVRCRGLRIDTLDSYDTFGVYILTPIWCVCLTVIIGFYGRIFLLVRAHGRKIFDKGSLPPPHKKKEDTKHKKEEKKTDIQNDAEKQQTFDSDQLKPNEKESCEENPLDLHPTSEELTTTFGTDSLDINKPELATEISRETKVTFIDELSN
ncbi:D(2) dopamine receptor-like [Sinocyclocheilus rhinocerous]|uniref:D(2) dopamine receptor-like n=1 Tax=Sinocyclocheilus rhinocerous TaxID=307959 RepID=UPI0007B7D73F|nr:PREDICTED: D(2) dopamine receptor-like [Sinocyclocheilus rhinocerous]